MTMRELHEIVLDLSKSMEPLRKAKQVVNNRGLECCFCTLGDQTDNGGGTYWHSPECPWRRAREYVEKEKNDVM